MCHELILQAPVLLLRELLSQQSADGVGMERSTGKRDVHEAPSSSPPWESLWTVDGPPPAGDADS